MQFVGAIYLIVFLITVASINRPNELTCFALSSLVIKPKFHVFKCYTEIGAIASEENLLFAQVQSTSNYITFAEPFEYTLLRLQFASPITWLVCFLALHP